MSRLRLGSIEFVNSLPVDLGLLSGAVPLDAEVTEGSPAELNVKILSGQLDISPVSTFWYARHQKDFLLLSDLSISSQSGVQSVILVSRLKFKDLAGARVAVTDKARTTPVLLEILCRLRHGFRPRLHVNNRPMEMIPHDCDAMLLIGDEALSAGERMKGEDVEIIDLAQEWERWTNLPFVFAVWVVRREVFRSEAGRVGQIHEALLRSKIWGTEHAEEVLERAARKTDLTREALRSYFSRLAYDFDEDLKKGLRLFLNYAVRCGLLDSFGEFETVGADHAALTMTP